MKLQASLEFFVIASAIGLLCVGTVAAYSKSVGSQNALVGSMYSNALSANVLASNDIPAVQEDPTATFYVPVNSTIGQASSIEATFYGCTNGTASVSAASQSLQLSSNGVSGVRISGIGTASIQFTPETQGSASVTLDYDMQCGQAQASGTKSFSTYALPSLYYSGSGNGTFSDAASISGRREAVSYGIGNASSVFNVTTQTHCTNIIWSGGESIAAQCNHEPGWQQYGGWGYYVYNGNCGNQGYYQYSTTTCIEPPSSGYNLSYTNTQDRSYNYSFTLSIQTGKGVIDANVSSGNTVSQATMGGRVVGNVTVSNVIGDAASPDADVLSAQGESTLANETSYTAYVQAKNNFYAVMSYNNGSTNNGAMQQAISEYQSAESTLEKSQPQKSPCTISAGLYTCAPLDPLSYTIRVRVERNAGIPNTTILYEGSVIEVNST